MPDREDFGRRLGSPGGVAAFFVRLEIAMAKCSSCGTTIAFGGIKAGGLRYCSEKCSRTGGWDLFFPRFQAALVRAFEENPPVLPEATGKTEGSEPAPEVWEADDVDPVGAGKDVFIALAGSVFTLAVGALIYWLVGLVGYPFHLQTFWHVIPVGAFLCGLVAGVGFLVALYSLHRLPTGLTFAAAVVSGLLGYLLIYGLMWWLMEFQGHKVRDEIGFVEFLGQALEGQRVRFGRGNGPANEVEPGKWGYPKFAINILGFTAGVVSWVAFAGGMGYCSRCKLYLNEIGRQSRSSSDPEEAGAALQPVIANLAAGRLQEAVDLHRASAEPDAGGYWTSIIKIEACPGCGTHHASLTATIPGDQGPQAVQGFEYRGECRKPVQLNR